MMIFIMFIMIMTDYKNKYDDDYDNDYDKTIMMMIMIMVMIKKNTTRTIIKWWQWCQWLRWWRWWYDNDDDENYVDDKNDNDNDVDEEEDYIMYHSVCHISHHIKWYTANIISYIVIWHKTLPYDMILGG